jgi:DNA (cytosine-5)-methyltransferase 1
MQKKWAYYNDIDPKVCEWIRQLIKLEQIAPGDVDNRSIKDVHTDDLKSFSQVHLFCGIGVWSYALRQAGWDDHREIFSGSCPCQPFSSAGKQAGTTDDRHLWPEMFRIIRELQPETIIGEQVASKAALTWWDIVASNLEAENYAAAAFDLSGASAGAPHLRSRLFWVANKLGHTSSDRQQRSGESRTTQEGREQEPRPRRELSERSQRPSSTDFMVHTSQSQRQEQCESKLHEPQQPRSASTSIIDLMAHPSSSTPTISIDRVSSSGNQEIGRDNPTKNHRSSSTGQTFWDECEWIECRDGKHRPAGIGINPLVGIPSMDRSAIRGELERILYRLLPTGHAIERTEEIEGIAKLIENSRNWGAIKSSSSKMADGNATNLVSGSNSSIENVNETQEARIMRLKGYGNAIVAPLAQVFIESLMEHYNSKEAAKKG